MKKHIIAIVLIAGLTMASAASANRGRGGHGNGGYGNCPQMQGQMMQQLDPATKEKVSKFFKDNQALHKQVAMKQAEKRAIMQSEKPDPQAAAKVAGELFDLRTAMHDKAEVAGVSQYLGPMGGGRGGRGHGFGSGTGPGMNMNAPQQ
ncbi:MAG: periplasmic heavy metal sensor [Proteobacteria bacterium]|nr:periplasmic heavy metal sensor [Pseudomonadota bacterium]